MKSDANGWSTRVDPEMAARYKAEGAWSDVTVGQRLQQLAAAHPSQLLVIDGEAEMTVAQCLDRALRLATALCGWGLNAGDVVSFQLPNWHEAVLVELACALGGFVCNPIVPIYRDREVGFIIADARSKVLFVPENFRGFDYRAMVDRLMGQGVTADHIIFVRSDERMFERLIETTAPATLVDPDPDHVKLLLYTSGTTGDPKGVLHTHNTIDCEVRNFSAHFGLGEHDVVLMPSTLGHITGYLYGIQLPVTLGIPVILMDSWDAKIAADLISEHRVTFTIGATPFLAELVQVATRDGLSLPSLRIFPCGGAPVPPSLVEAAERILTSCTVCRVYGSTEAPTVSLGSMGDVPIGIRAETDGKVVGHNVRLILADGSEAERGQDGEITTRGPEVFVGYKETSQNDAFDEQGYFKTGDLGVLDSDGNLMVTGRIKDIIIRGGENISAKEVEDAIHLHPAISEAAVVAMPHPRLGETCCAFVTLRPGEIFDFEAMLATLTEQGLAKQKWPERLEIIAEMPLTPSGKIRKNILREQVREAVQAR
ncbi:AMP-binding protein [Sphingobium sp. HWE2-09]|uniref:AMP-binding protein n=1 Tax=Sphingobium sp. HWE2-09 TaxID=3108390 RepID=UPI002DCAD90C|nr:AMP-binding protein [Sphingobium sp. HWE2-09]